MKSFLSRWVSICLFNLFLVAILGTLLRYKISFSIPWLDQKFLLHSHSHFAFSGWVSQCLMVLLVHHLARLSEGLLGESLVQRYKAVLYANLGVSYGMMISFMIQGYAFFSITFSSLSIAVFVWFSVFYWHDLSRMPIRLIAHKWFKASLVYGLISCLGVVSLAYLMANKLNDQHWYLASVYYFLHFQYNGWFLFAGMGLFFEKLEQNESNRKSLLLAFRLFAYACIPAYLLSILWFEFPGPLNVVLIAVVLAQVWGWLLILKACRRSMAMLRTMFLPFGRFLFVLAAVAFSIKLVLQTASVHPALSQLSYGFRPIIIGYLHLVLLGVTTIFLLGYVFSLELIKISKLVRVSAIIFIVGIIFNELLLLWQGVAALSYTAVANINLYLFGAAIILLAGSDLMVLGARLNAFRSAG